MTPVHDKLNSFGAFKLLNGIDIDNLVLLSLDVISIFTNIPLDFVINSIEKRWSLILLTKTNIPYVEFVEMLQFVFIITFFIFNNKIYKQIFKVTYGDTYDPPPGPYFSWDCEI